MVRGSNALLLVLVIISSISLSYAQTNEWAWMGGSTTAGNFGVYGTLDVPTTGNAPGGRSQPVTWTDSQGNLWLFGGDGFDSLGNPGYLNDLWEYNHATGEWKWVSGSDDLGGSFNAGIGVYGTLKTPALGNYPLDGRERWAGLTMSGTSGSSEDSVTA